MAILFTIIKNVCVFADQIVNRTPLLEVLVFYDAATSNFTKLYAYFV